MKMGCRYGTSQIDGVQAQMSVRAVTPFRNEQRDYSSTRAFTQHPAKGVGIIGSSLI